ncbi:Protein KIAA0649 [Heterocephalus glaber]|uniref:Protein KIAA0649 n=1 Tax=Heterocephalus glaber TaxID=10181 RepID=G5B8J1_HETGA|nr:Protein KIAA0649 [Heterocephalus glaber]
MLLGRGTMSSGLCQRCKGLTTCLGWLERGLLVPAPSDRALPGMQTLASPDPGRMFLMNAPPVVTLQSRWEAFSPPGSFRFPGCFSESKEDVARASVSAKVQMIISTLQQHNEVPLGMSAERPAQRSQKAERCLNTRPATSPSTCREQPPAFAACGLAARSDPPGEGEAAGFGPLVLDSDSDDSVDRDIEEAIQEYLKARSGGTQPGSGGAPPDRVSAGGGRCKLELPHSSTPPALGPPKLAPVSGSVSGSSVGAGEDQGSASPVSVSSEDSFEQSIRVEIEQFLHEKRQHENPKCDAFMDKRPDPNEDIARATLKSNKEPPIKAAPRQDLRGTLKEFVFRKPPRVAKMSLQPRSLRPKVSPEPETVGSMRLAVPKPEAAQSKGGVQRSTGAGRRGWQVRSPALVHEASDSSSDDGIEEAIQLYQLEKTRKETSGDALPRTQLREEVLPGPPASGTSSAMKSALSEAHRRAPSRKKPVALKAADPGPGVLDPDPSFKLVKDAKASAPPVNTSTRAESAERVSCRADSSTELMCAEAILDISKTILPAPVEDSNGPPSASPHLCSPDVPSRSDGDSSSVDSDDSIEQEIRTFLALKAQSESVLASAESCPQPTQGLLLLPGPSSQASDPKAPPSNKTPEPSLSCKRKRRAFSLREGVPWGGTQPGLFSAPLGLPLQGPSFSAFRETPAGHSPVFGSPHLLTKKGGSHWPSRKAQARLGLQNRKNSGSEENILDLRYQRRVIDRDNEDQEALGSDTSVEDGGGTSVVKGRGLTL